LLRALADHYLLRQQKLKKILLEDELGICADLENDMATLIDSYVDEWKQAVTDPALRKQFRQFVNTVSRGGSF
jgi:nitrite reductase (NAD(P)H)